MVTIKNYIKESIFDNPKEIAKKDITVQPKNKDELQKIIINEVKKYKEGETVDLNFIDTSKINDMSSLFYNTTLKRFNYDIDEWDVSNVEDTSGMFYGCEYFNNNLNNWDISNVKYCNDMFVNCVNFNSDLSNWKFNKKLKNINMMFFNCKSFEGNGIENWDVSNITSINSTFCNSGIHVDLNNWDVQNMINMGGAFYGCKKFNSDLSNWDVRKVTNLINTFAYCDKFEGKGLDNWNLNKCKMSGIIHNCVSLKKIPSWYKNDD